MDLPEDKKKLSGDLKDRSALLRSLPEDFKGALHLSIESADGSYEADLLVHNGFVISSALKELSSKRSVYGESAFQEISGKIRSAKGALMAYALTDNEFHLIVNANEGALLENVREVGKAFFEPGPPGENKQDAGVDDLQTQWSNLLGAWKKIEEKEKPYMEMLAQEELKAESEEQAANQIILADEMLAKSREAESEDAQPETQTEKLSGEQAQTREDPFSESMKIQEPEENALDSPDEKPEDRLLDEMILRDESGEEEKKKRGNAGESISSNQETRSDPSMYYPSARPVPEQTADLPGKEQVSLRDEIRQERKRLVVPENTPAKPQEGLEDAITEDILKEIEERFVKAPDESVEAVEDEEFQPEAAAEETEDSEEEKEEEEKPKPPEDEESAQDNKILADQIRQELREHIRRMRASVQESEDVKKPPEPKPIKKTLPIPSPPIIQKRLPEAPREKTIPEPQKDNRPPQPLFERMPTASERKAMPAPRAERIAEAMKKEALPKTPPLEPPKPKDIAPEMDAPVDEEIKEDMQAPEEVTAAPEDTVQDSPQQLAASKKPDEWMDKASAEIQKLKKSVDVTWGYDKQKKRFVGKEKPPQKPPEAAATVTGSVPQNIQQPIQSAQKAAMEPPKQSAAPGDYAAGQKTPATAAQQESKPIKPQIIESVQEQLDKKIPVIPCLKKKMGFLDKLKFASSKEAILVIQTIDGKKTLEEISKETALKIEALKPIIEKLMDEGYVALKK